MTPPKPMTANEIARELLENLSFAVTDDERVGVIERVIAPIIQERDNYVYGYTRTTDDLVAARDKLARAETQVQELREALQEISGETMLARYDTGFESSRIPTDGAKKARAALAKLDGQG